MALKYAEILSKTRKIERAEKARATQLNTENGLSDTMSEKPKTVKTDTRKEVTETFNIPRRKLEYIKEIQEVKPEVIPQILAGEKKIIEVKRETEKEKLKPTPIFDGTYQIIYTDPLITLKQRNGVPFSNNKISDKNSVFSRTT